MADNKHHERTKQRPAATPRDRPGPDHIADEPTADTDVPDATVRSPTTETGLPVEEQVRKEWDPQKDGGLSTPLSESGRDAAR